MSENLYIPIKASRKEKYEAITPQIQSLVESESNIIANLANIAAVLREAFEFFWVGFYTVQDEELVLAPFQGPLACTRIKYGRGVCGTAWAKAQTQLVEDVEQFPGHIACSSSSRSEIVVPIIKNGSVVAVLDIDSDKLCDFSQIDVEYLEKIVQIIENEVF